MTAVLSWVNRLIDAVLTPSSEIATLPAANVVDPHLVVVWRSGATSGYLDADLGSPAPVGAFGAFGTNFTGQATRRLRLSTVAPGGAEVHDSGVAGAQVAAGYGQWLYVLPADLAARFVRFDFDDPGLAGVGSFDVGALWAGPSWRPGANYSHGAAAGWVDPSTVSKSRGGQAYIDLLPRYRAVELAFEWLTEAEVHDNAFELDRLSGVADNVLLVPDPASPYLNRQALLGRLVETAEVIHRELEVYRKLYRLEERL